MSKNVWALEFEIILNPNPTRASKFRAYRIRIWIHNSDSNCLLGEACFNPQDDEDVEDSNLEAPLMTFQRGEDVPSDFEVPFKNSDG